MQSSDNSLKDILEKERLEKIWLDDNNILVYTKKENDIIVSIFYASVAGTIASVHEQYLKTISIEEYLEKDTYIRISEDNKLIAFIEKENNNLYLEKIYSIDEHNYYFDTIDAGLHYNQEPVEGPDMAHYDSESEILLGKLFASVAIYQDLNHFKDGFSN